MKTKTPQEIMPKEVKKILDSQEIIWHSSYVGTVDVEVDGIRYRKVVYATGQGKHRRESVFYKKVK